MDKKYLCQYLTIVSPKRMEWNIFYLSIMMKAMMQKLSYLHPSKINELPKLPGIYAFFKRKVILYLGKAVDIRERVKNHFQQPTYKDRLFLESISRIGYRKTSSEIEALLLESQWIKKLQPKYNVMWKDDKNYLYVVITKEKLPRVLIVHREDLPGDYIGPFVDSSALKKTLKLLRKIFPYYTIAHHPKGRCPWCHLHLCPGSELNGIKYHKDLQRLRAVLQGKKTSVLTAIKREMQEASRSQDYEKAAQLRDNASALEKILSHAHVFPDNYLTPVKEAAIGAILQKIIRTNNIISRIEAYDIANLQGKEATGSMVVAINGKLAKDQYRKFRIRLPSKPNDTAMIGEVVSRRLNHPEWPWPELMIIDGGKGQLSSAVKSRDESGISKERIKIGAVAKKRNELFLEKRPQPLLLESLPLEVFNIILLLRDEAHRFARAYHHHLRKIDFQENE